MSEPPQMLTIPAPRLDRSEIALVVVDSEGNHVVNSLTRQAVTHAEPAAWGHLLRHMLQRLDDQR